MRFLSIVITGIWLLIGTVIEAAVIYVPDNYSTIQQAIDSSADGDTILVRPWTYFENVNFNGHRVVLASLYLTTRDSSYIYSTIIDGNHSGTAVTFDGSYGNDTKIYGFTIENGYGTSSSAGILCRNGANPTISKNRIRSNLTDGDIIGAPGISCDQSNPVITQNWIMDNISIGTLSSGGGIFCGNNSNPIITENFIIRNQNDGGNGAGIYCDNSRPTINRNIVFENEGGDGSGLYLQSSNPVIVNTIFWNNTSLSGDDFSINASDPIITYSDIEGGWPGTANIDCDPRFCDPVNNIFTLHFESCCRGSGFEGIDIGVLQGIGCGDSYCGEYVIGDFGNNGLFNIADIVDSFSNLKTGSPIAGLLCECEPGSGVIWAVSMDIDNSCGFNISDVIAGFSRLKTGSPIPAPCRICPPGIP